MLFRKKSTIKEFGAGAISDPIDLRDESYDEVVMGEAPLTNEEWLRGFDIEKKLNFELPIKHQNGSLSCVWQAISYYVGILNLVETKIYKEVSAKAGYSQVCLPQGGAYIRSGIKLAVNWGALTENIVPSYKNNKPPPEKFMRDLSWKNEAIDKKAKVLQAKRYKMIESKNNMDLFAMAIRDNGGVVGGLYMGNSSTWRTNEPKPTTREGGHALYYGKFGIDKLGKYIATPNSWGDRKKDELHPDGWQKLRQDYFNNLYQFSPWTLLDKPNINQISQEAQDVLAGNDKKIIIEGEGVGRKGIVINNKLMNISKERSAEACLYSLANNGNGITISTKLYDEIYCIDSNF